MPAEKGTPTESLMTSQNKKLLKIFIYLMLWRADTEKTQHSFVDKVGQGIYWQGSDKTLRPDDDRMRGLGTWRHTEGVPHACTARGA